MVIGRVVASDGALRAEEVEGLGRAREAAPPDWRERDIVRMKVRRWRRSVMVEIVQW